MVRLYSSIVIGASLLHSALAQSSCSTLTPKATPSVAAGFEARLVATGLTKPRGIIFDTKDNLLVVQSGKGISSASLGNESGTCVTLGQWQDVITDPDLNHGIEFSGDGRTLYASTTEAAYAWSYDAETSRNTSAPQTLVTGMANSDHTTRTLLLSRNVPGMLIISRGSTSNLDLLAADLATGHSQLKAFNLTGLMSPYDFNNDGLRLGWGLRNSVGVAENPITGGIWSVENSVDNMERDGVDVHQNNPGEELNFHGYLNGTEYAQQGQNYGYPNCYAAWNTTEIPSSSELRTGMQFAIGDQNATVNDTLCRDDFVPPVLTFQAHMAPLDIKFNGNATAAWVTFHGSWNRQPPAGYKLSVIEFANGSPVAPSDSTSATTDILTNPDLSKCPNNCFRPVGLAWDSQGRLFMSSDSTGEIWMITRTDGGSTESVNPTTGSPSGTAGGSPAASSSAAASSTKLGMVGLGSLALGAVHALLS